MTRFEPGGTERQMIELIRRLPPNRWTVHVACCDTEGAWFERLNDAAVTVETFPIDGFFNRATLGEMRRFARWCRTRQIAVVHTTELYSNVFGLAAAALSWVPVRIANRREINPDKSTVQLLTQRTAYAFADRIVANSRAAADRLRREGVRGRKIVVVPNGIDGTAFDDREPRRVLRRVITVANLRREKGHDVLIDAAAIVLRRFPDATFECVGDGPERAALAARADAAAISYAFSFAGYVHDVPARLAAADVFVLPSRSEAFPNAVLEAMAAGMPVVASAVGGVPELVDDGRTGLLAVADDPPALADRLCHVMADAGLGARLGAAARREALGRYSFDRMVGSFESIYLSELQRRGALSAEQVQLAAS